MRARSIAVAAALATASGLVAAKLPAPTLTDAQKAAAAEAAAKTAHAGKVGAYQQCEAENRVAAKYIAAEKAKGKTITPQLTQPCVNPGPFQSAAAAAAPAPAAAAAPAPASKAASAPAAKPAAPAPAAKK
jgi:hypothetical protein